MADPEAAFQLRLQDQRLKMQKHFEETQVQIEKDHQSEKQFLEMQVLESK